MQNIDELLKQYKKQSKSVSVASDAVQEKFDEKMEKMNLAQKEKQAESVAGTLGVSYINLVGMPIPPDTLTIFTKEEAQKYKAVVFFSNDQEIRVASLDTENEELKKN